MSANTTLIPHLAVIDSSVAVCSSKAFEVLRQSLLQEAKLSANEMTEKSRAASASQKQRKRDSRTAASGDRRAVQEALMQPNRPRHNHELHNIAGENDTPVIVEPSRPRPKAKPSAGTRPPST